MFSVSSFKSFCDTFMVFFRPVLIHVNGVSDSVIEKEFFTNIVDFGNLLQS